MAAWQNGSRTEKRQADRSTNATSVLVCKKWTSERSAHQPTQNSGSTGPPPPSLCQLPVHKHHARTRVTRLRAHRQPVLDARHVELHPLHPRGDLGGAVARRVVAPNDVEVAAIPGGPPVRHNDAEEGEVAAAPAGEPDADDHPGRRGGRYAALGGGGEPEEKVQGGGAEETKVRMRDEGGRLGGGAGEAVLDGAAERRRRCLHGERSYATPT